jgi:pimeloyl-ACP methyl ester carboxylesterase
MRRLRSWLTSVALAVAAVVGPGLSSASAAGIGIVLVHFRSSWPGEFDNIRPKLEAAGYMTIAPEMCWSVFKLYGATLDECQKEIDVAIAGLKGRGADRIVVAGHDSGGMSALHYAGAHPELAGLIVWGPRANIRFNDDENLLTALAMVKAGDGDKKGNFNNGRMWATANALLSFEGPNSPFADPERLIAKVSVPLFWMAANDDTGPRDPSARFNLAKKTPLNTIVWSRTDQYSMVDVSIAEVIAWLDKLKASTTAAAVR